MHSIRSVAIPAIFLLTIGEALADHGYPCETLAPNVQHASVSQRVTYDGTGLFHYQYSVDNPLPNTGCIEGFAFSVQAATAQPPPTGLPRPRGNFRHPSDSAYWCPESPLPPGIYALPIGAISSEHWDACVSGKKRMPQLRLPSGSAEFSTGPRNSASLMAPGTSVQNAIELISPSPPGIVQAHIAPFWDPSIADDDPRRPLVPDGVEPLWKLLNITGPVDPAIYPRTLQNPFLGSSGEDNDRARNFLRYLNPGASSTDLAASATPITFNLVILYGPTIRPNTFRARLDGQDITCLFHPALNGAEVIPLTFDGTNATHVLRVSVKGTTARRHGEEDEEATARKSDRLVFQVGTGGRVDNDDGEDRGNDEHAACPEHHEEHEGHERGSEHGERHH